MDTTSTTPVALLLTEDGTIEEIPVPGHIDWATLRRLLGCQYVDVIRLTTTLDMWVDDEFLYTRDKINYVATGLARRYGHATQICGPVLLAGFNDEGYTIGLARYQVAGVLAALGDVAA